MRTSALKVSEFADVYSGGTPSTQEPNFWSGDVVWITPKDLSHHTGVFISEGERYISEDGLKTSSVCLLPKGTVILSSRAPVGYVAVAGCSLSTNQGCKNLVCKKGIADSIFVYYLLKSSTATLEAHATGSTFKELSTSRLKNISFLLPEIEVQQRIASIISIYDDLIENNRRRIQLLEQSARLLYKEWFISLRFPGHEHVKINNGVPEGWERKKIVDVCETVGGGTPSTTVSDYWDGDITWVVPSDITRNGCLVLIDSERKISEKGLRGSSAKMVPPNTILMTSRASVGYFALMDREVCTNQGFINIIPHDKQSRMYILFNLMSRVNEIRSNAKGSTYPEISKSRFRGMDLLFPTKAVMWDFGVVTEDIVNQIRCLKKQILSLEKARDILLPRLMSGDVVV